MGDPPVRSDFEALVAEGEAVPLGGWDFSWFAGRATEERPPWGYARLLADRVPGSGSVLDVQTGGGEVLAEVLAGVPAARPAVAATESWPPNVERARRNLAPFGGQVTGIDADGPLPYPDRSFDLVVSRHPTVTNWPEIARVLRPGGAYLSQQIGPGSNRELTDWMMGPQPVNPNRRPEAAVAAAARAGLRLVEVRTATLEVTFADVGAVVHFLRKVLWTVPGFSVAAYRDPLERLHGHIVDHGRFVSHAERFLIEVSRPADDAD